MANITLAIGGTDFEFNVDSVAFNKYQDEITMDKKITPAKNLLRRTLVDQKKKEALDELCDNKGLTLNILGALIEEYQGGVEISVKK